MREAVHIFLKDSRHLRIPIAIILAWTGIFLAASASVRPWRPIALMDGWFGGVLDSILYFSTYVLPVGWWFLIAFAFHADAIPGTRQFWVTRPYRRSSLFGAKVLFVLAYVALPLSVAQFATVMALGFPFGASISGMVWSQALILAVLVLPAAALAALTSTLTQFVVIGFAVPLLIIASHLLPPWGPLEWIRDSIAIAIVIIVTGAVLYLQFAYRRTRSSRLIALAGLLVLAASLPLLSWRTAFALQSQVDADWAGHLTADLVRRAHPREGRPSFAEGPLTFQLGGLPAATPIACEAAEATIEAQGRIWKTDLDIAPRRIISRVDDGCTLFVSNAVIQEVGTRPVQIHAIVYITAFGPERLVKVPIAEHATTVQNSAVCAGTTWRSFGRVGSQTIDRSQTFVSCQSAFRDPRELILLSSPVSGQQPGPRFSYSPFPSELRIGPVAYVASFNMRPVEQVTLAIREPLAHIRAVVEATNVQLQDALR